MSVCIWCRSCLEVKVHINRYIERNTTTDPHRILPSSMESEKSVYSGKQVIDVKGKDVEAVKGKRTEEYHLKPV